MTSSGAGPLSTPLTVHAGVDLPVIGGPMYPCSNPELVAAVSREGGLGVLQPVSLTLVHGWDFREGVRFIRSLTDRPVGMNALIEGSSRVYRERMEAWIDIALQEGVRFFVTSLGKPRWVVDRVHAVGGVVYHDVTERKWALKALDSGVDGLIGVNALAGGHAGPLTPEALLDEVGDLGLPVVRAGGVGRARDFVASLEMGYAGVQMGTRFIATPECAASDAYKAAVVAADADDIVLSERITGVPVALINTPWVQAQGTRAGPLARRLLRGRRTKHWMRTLYTLTSAFRLRRSYRSEAPRQEIWQAGRSVEGVERVETVADILQQFRELALDTRPG
ncbi:MAG TPA: nitronate monooxygenase [Longimicrobiales bacterium]|nr:nitronate monooxygenase [Longimicrobiales bacterium]